MPNVRRSTLVLLALLAATISGSASAQNTDSVTNTNTPVPSGPRLSMMVVSPSLAPHIEANSPFVAPADRKDPAVAGILSFFLPGIGSFYAGNTTHGVVHLGVDLGAYAVMLGGAYNLNGGALAAGYLVLLGNDIWSIFTAVDDANDYNSRGTAPAGRIVGDLYIRPDINRTVATPTPRGARAATAIQVVQWRY